MIVPIDDCGFINFLRQAPKGQTDAIVSTSGYHVGAGMLDVRWPSGGPESSTRRYRARPDHPRYTGRERSDAARGLRSRVRLSPPRASCPRLHAPAEMFEPPFPE